MTRRLLNLLIALCLVLLLGVICLWVRTHTVRDWLRFNRVAAGQPLRRDRFQLLTHPGVLVVTHQRSVYTERPPGFRERLARADGLRWNMLEPLQPWVPPVPARRTHRLGFTHLTHSAAVGPSQLTSTTVSAPIWALATLCALPAVVRWTRPLLRRAPDGRCVHCGYELRDTPDWCPECGKATSNDRSLSGRSDTPGECHEAFRVHAPGMGRGGRGGRAGAGFGARAHLGHGPGRR